MAGEALALKYNSSLVFGKMARLFCGCADSLMVDSFLHLDFPFSFLSLSYILSSQRVWELYALNRFMCLIIISFKDLQCHAAVAVTLLPWGVEKVKILHQGKGKN